MRNRLRRLLTLVVATSFAATGLVAMSSTPAAADQWCGILYPCGEVNNNSPLWIMVRDNWCWGDNAPRYGTSPWTCSGSIAQLYPGQKSRNNLPDSFDDTDSFRVDAGCKTKYNIPGVAHAGIEDRRGKAQHKWIKIQDTDTATITYQVCSGSPAKYWVDTFATATGYQDGWCYQAPVTNQRCQPDGVLWSGTSYVFCKIWGKEVRVSGNYNSWWLLTDLDSVNSGRDGRAFVSAYYLSRWGNNVAKDNSGVVIPDC
ncbi:MAG: hypothetical protein L0Y54_07970 [Sporichthyaceae bacterium]|nr:hypothetical protein [Sporichthyaceae bacterium]